MLAQDAEYSGRLELRDEAGRSWRAVGEFRCIEPRVVDEDGQGHIVLWWGRAYARGTWGDPTVVNTIVDLDFDELPPARGLVIKWEHPDRSSIEGCSVAWMYGLDGSPWPIDAPPGAGGAGVREPRRPLPTSPSSRLPMDPDDM